MSSLNGVNRIKEIISVIPVIPLANAQIILFCIKLNEKNIIEEIVKVTTNVKKIFIEKKFFLKDKRKNMSLTMFETKEDTAKPIGAANSVILINIIRIVMKTTNLIIEAMRFSFSLSPIKRIVPQGPVIHSIIDAIVSKIKIML